MTTLTTTLKAGIVAALSGAAVLAGTPGWVGPAAADISLATGTAASKADLVYAAQTTIAASGNTTLDLTGGTMKNPIGEALVFAKVKAIFISAAAANTNNVVIGNAAATGFVGPFGADTETLAVKPGGRILLAAPVGGWAVTANTDDIIKLLNSGGTTGVTFDIVIIGTSA